MSPQMNKTMRLVRSMTAMLLVALGLIIVGRGLIEGAPLTFTATGVLMAGLGFYRLRLMGVGKLGQR